MIADDESDWVNDILDMIPDDIDLTINSVVVKIDTTSDTCDNHFTIVWINRYLF